MARRDRVAVVGLGYWGPNLLRNLVGLIGVENCVAVDPSIDRLLNVARQYPAITYRTSLEQTLSLDAPTAVIIATPVSTHFALAQEALVGGCHVLVEKPLAGSAREAHQLVELADRVDRHLMVGHTFLFSPRVERIKCLLEEKRLGQVQYVTSSRLNLGLHQRDVGVIWDLAPHDFSIIFHCLNDFPETIQTTGRCVVQPGVLDVAFITMRFPSGVVAAVNISWLSPQKVRNTVVVGDAQMLVYDDIDNDQPLKIYDKGVEVGQPGDFGEHQLFYRHGDVLAPYVAPREPLSQELSHFLGAIHGSRPELSDGVFGARVVDALEAANRSFEVGGAVVAVSQPPSSVVDVRSARESSMAAEPVA